MPGAAEEGCMQIRQSTGQSKNVKGEGEKERTEEEHSTEGKHETSRGQQTEGKKEKKNRKERKEQNQQSVKERQTERGQSSAQVQSHSEEGLHSASLHGNVNTYRYACIYSAAADDNINISFD